MIKSPIAVISNTSGTTADVKAASTAPVAADKALVVAVSPNSPQSLVDNAAFTDGTSRVTPAGFIFDEVAGPALSENDVAAARVDSKRAQVSVIEDGTARGVGQRATVLPASTSPTPTNTSLVVGLSPNGNQATEATLINFSNKVNNGETATSQAVSVVISKENSYSASTLDTFVAQANADDIFYIKASPDRYVFVTRLWFTATCAGGEKNTFVRVLRRDGANDNQNGVDFVKHYTGNPPSNATIQYYTSNPGVGTLVGAFWSGIIPVNHDIKTDITQSIYTWNWEAPSPKQAILLRKGTEEGLSINLAGLNLDPLVCACGVEWYET